MTVEVRETSFEEADAVHQHIPEFGDDHLQQNHAEKGVPGADPTYLVASHDGEPAGYLIAYDKFQDGSYYVWMAGVRPDHRRNGVMSALVSDVLDIARDRGYDSVKIKTRNERRGMRHFLIDHGFDVCGFEPVGDLERHEILHIRDV
ncbi:MAG: GNAT family N-acetyltransferase [Candidatus Nanohaloarchaea archaeon]|nr:GNAT family N-acetyltransferase [Candidatus Nanohaloarchaea archaeon]